MTDIDAEIRSRLTELRQDYQTGEAQLHELVRQETALRETLLRISGAVQVLEEVVASTSTADQGTAVSSSGTDMTPETKGNDPADVRGNGASTGEFLTVP